MTPEREDWLTVQYAWAIQNDSVWYNQATSFTQKDFPKFRRVTGNFISKTRQLLGDSLNNEEWGFILIYLWGSLGRDPKDALTDTEAVGFEGYAKALAIIQPAALHAEIEQHMQNADEHFASVDEKLKQIEQENKMSQQAFVTKTYIFGADVEGMTEEQLIEAIKKVEAEIAKLKEVKTKSVKITCKVKDLEEMLDKIVGVLDAK